MLREQTICTLIGSSRAVRGWEARGGRPEVQDLEWEGQGVNLEEGWAAMVGAEDQKGNRPPRKAGCSTTDQAEVGLGVQRGPFFLETGVKNECWGRRDRDFATERRSSWGTG